MPMHIFATLSSPSGTIPNDVYSQELLINAYEQKQMIYDLAVDHTGEQ